MCSCMFEILCIVDAIFRLTEELVMQIKLTIRKELSARHIPSIILEIADIPVSVLFYSNLICLAGCTHIVKLDTVKVQFQHFDEIKFDELLNMILCKALQSLANSVI